MVAVDNERSSQNGIEKFDSSNSTDSNIPANSTDSNSNRPANRYRKYLQETIPAFQRASVMQGVALQPSASAADADIPNSNSS